ncbi:AAA family ATPase [Pseudomonas sp. SST3]|uniref:AAA family ATPase n=1 Tax=Pseudomonas sp. SST3 TaxID=2267882 RepID=UPI0014448E9F|nr:ATP-binding protein [Pseudomonas sp. SST3]NKQ13435.1 ATP-binding protein [Pseudomonas sp. SST3]
MPTLHLLCGKIASGKSTLAKTLAAEQGVIVLSEDQWLANLYPGEIQSIADYLRCALRVRGVLEPLVIDLLACGVNVVLDFPANTLANRQWLLGLAQAAKVPHCLHYLELDDATNHDFAASDAEFDLITRHFSVPSEEEGLVIEVHRP